MCTRNPLRDGDESDVYLFGGVNKDALVLNTLYHFYMDRFTAEIEFEEVVFRHGSVPDPRERATLTTVSRDKAILFGGVCDKAISEPWLLFLHPYQREWVRLKQEGLSFPSERYSHSCTYYSKDKAVIFGGYDGKDLLSELWTMRLYNKQKECMTRSPVHISRFCVLGEDRTK
jgi:hypothetical protein